MLFYRAITIIPIKTHYTYLIYLHTTRTPQKLALQNRGAYLKLEADFSAQNRSMKKL